MKLFCQEWVSHIFLTFYSTSNNTFIHEYKCVFQNKSFWRKIQQNGNEINAFVVQKGTPCSANKEGNL